MLGTDGNLKIWVGSLGFATEMKLPLLAEPPVLFDECTILTESSSSSPSNLGRRRAAILTLCMDAMVANGWSGDGRRTEQSVTEVAGRVQDWALVQVNTGRGAHVTVIVLGSDHPCVAEPAASAAPVKLLLPCLLEALSFSGFIRN